MMCGFIYFKTLPGVGPLGAKIKLSICLFQKYFLYNNYLRGRAQGEGGDFPPFPEIVTRTLKIEVIQNKENIKIRIVCPPLMPDLRVPKFWEVTLYDRSSEELCVCLHHENNKQLVFQMWANK